MKKLIYIALVFFLLSGTAHAGNVSKAKEFMAADMYPAAIALLEKEVFGIGGDLSKGNPGNHEAQYLLGLCYVRTGKLNAADERFASAIQLRSAYGNKIANGLKGIGLDSVKQGQLKTALMIFNRAEFYEPAIIGEAVRELLALGNGYLTRNRGDRADIAFEAAVSLNSSYEGEACGKQYAAGLETNDETAINLLPQKSYCPTYNRMAGEKLIGIARNKAMHGEDAEKEKYKKAAAKYLGRELADVLLPEVVVHGPGEYIFELQAGEMTPYWVSFPDGRKSNWQFYNTKGSDFVTITSDGVVIGKNEHFDGKFVKFKIKALTDSYIKLVVK